MSSTCRDWLTWFQTLGPYSLTRQTAWSTRTCRSSKQSCFNVDSTYVTLTYVTSTLVQRNFYTGNQNNYFKVCETASSNIDLLLISDLCMATGAYDLYILAITLLGNGSSGYLTAWQRVPLDYTYHWSYLATVSMTLCLAAEQSLRLVLTTSGLQWCSL